jgi:hypothetical protein
MRDKEKQRVYWQKYYAEHKERLLAKQRRERTTEEGLSKIRAQRAVYRRKNRGRLQAERREYMSQNGTRWRFKYPERVLARELVKKALRAGELVRQPCWCGAPGQAHHDDYDKPYQVTWLCIKHHAEHHRKQSHGRPRG